jgi:hypothetical protein
MRYQDRCTGTTRRFNERYSKSSSVASLAGYGDADAAGSAGPAGHARAFAFGSMLARQRQCLMFVYDRHQQQYTTTMRPEEIIAQLTGEFACREQQIQHLTALYNVCCPSNAPSCTTNRLGASPLTSHCQHPWPDSYWQVVDPAHILPPFPNTAYHHQCARMHNCAASPRAHRCSFSRCAGGGIR